MGRLSLNGPLRQQKGVLLEDAEYKNGMLHGNFKTYQPDGKVKVVHIPMANRIKNKASGRRIFLGME